MTISAQEIAVWQTAIDQIAALHNIIPEKHRDPARAIAIFRDTYDDLWVEVVNNVANGGTAIAAEAETILVDLGNNPDYVEVVEAVTGEDLE